MTKTQRCMDLLADGPATTADMCAALGWTSRDGGSFMAYMHKAGRVYKRTFAQMDIDTETQLDVSLWALPEHAEAWNATPHPLARKPNCTRS